MIDVDNGIIVDVEATTAIRQAAVLAGLGLSRPNAALLQRAYGLVGDRQRPNCLTSFEPLTLAICLSVKSLPMLNPFVMRLLRSAACLSSA
jgi:hypothetical protein